MINTSIESRILTASILLFGSILAASGTAFAGQDQSDYTKMSPEELAEHLIFEQRGFVLDQETQEGGTVRNRLTQDRIQKICSSLQGKPVDSATAKTVTGIARENMVYPKGGIRLGDWKAGEAIANNAFGFRVGHKTDDHGSKPTGGLCINCHVLDPQGDLPGGSIGPELAKYGSNRGRSEAVLKYTYEILYNPHAVFPCTRMPRLGANGFLTQEQIRHVMAYLLDPDSPVNR